MSKIEEILKKEVGDFTDLHDWDNSCNASALYTGFHMVNVAMDKIKKLEKQIESWSKLSKTQMEMLEESIKENKQLESEVKDYRERLGLRT